MAAPRLWQAFQLGQSLRELMPNISPVTALVQQVRFKKRQHVVNKKSDKPKAKVKQKVIKVIEEPKVSEAWLNKKPIDDVWLRYHYPPPKYSLSEAIANHRELNAPEMFDNMDGVVFVDLEINMATKKKTRFLGQFSDTVRIPHRFEDDEEKRIIAFAKTIEDQEKAKAKGALYAGDQNLVKEVSSGIIDKSEFDFVICTPDILQEVATIRSILRDRFPNVGKGNLRTDVDEMMDLYQHGKFYQSERENADNHSQSTVRLMLGPLTMPSEHLIENFQAYRSSVLSHQGKMSVGQFIKKAIITCPPSKEKFYLLDDELNEKGNMKKSEKSKTEEDYDEDDDRNIAIATS